MKPKGSRMKAIKENKYLHKCIINLWSEFLQGLSEAKSLVGFREELGISVDNGNIWSCGKREGSAGPQLLPRAGTGTGSVQTLRKMALATQTWLREGGTSIIDHSTQVNATVSFISGGDCDGTMTVLRSFYPSRAQKRGLNTRGKLEPEQIDNFCLTQVLSQHS